jgi:ATP-binding cassette subfamily F protein 3
MNEESVRLCLKDIFRDIDNDTLDYFQSIILDAGTLDEESIKEMLVPFIESYGFATSNAEAESLCVTLCENLRSMGLSNKGNVSYDDVPKLLEKSVVLGEVTNSVFSESEKRAIEKMWGFDTIRSKKNSVMESTEAGSAKYERKAAKEQKKFLDELDRKLGVDVVDENAQISSMVLPDFSGNSREKDIQVNTFNLVYGGNLLLEDADLKLVYGRRYGLIGRNGVGKTTLLKHMASFDIQGFPRHHRILHVKQVCYPNNSLAKTCYHCD